MAVQKNRGGTSGAERNALTPSAHEPARTRPYHHGAVRERLIAEALALAGEGGAPSVSLREAARRVGVSHAAAYHHFRDKTELIAAAATNGMMDLADKLEHAEQQAVGDPGERVCRIGAAYVHFALSEPAAFRLMFATEVAHKARFLELRRASDAAAAPLLRALQLWRGAAPGPIDVEVRELAVVLWSLVHGLSVLALDAQFDEGELRVSEANRVEVYQDLVWRALARHLAAERELGAP